MKANKPMRQFLAWSVGRHLFGVDVHLCREVNRNTQVTEVPLAPPTVCGIVNLRGDVVTVLNLPVILGVSGIAPEGVRTRWVVIRLNTGLGSAAVLADDILDVYPIGGDVTLQQVPEHFGEDQLRILTGAVRVGEHVVLLIDPEAVASAARQEIPR